MNSVVVHKVHDVIVVQGRKDLIIAPAPQNYSVVERVEQGPPGPSSPGATDRNHLHLQSIASAEWTIAHGLGKYPSVTILDSAGDEVDGEVTHVDLDTLVIRFSAAFSGRASLN